MRIKHTAFVMLSAAAIVAGCSLVVDTNDRSQCQTNADCDANPLWRGRVCELGFCAIKQKNPDLVSVDSGESCVSTQLCTQTNSKRASVCKAAGTPCVPWVIDDECPSITGKWDDPNAIMIGSIITLRNKIGGGATKTNAYAERLTRAMDLAIQEIDQKLPGGIQVGLQSRPIALLHCNSFGNSSDALKRFQFLTDVVGAKAIIADGTEDYAAIAQAAADKKVAVVCADCLVPFPQKPWKILPPITLDAHLVAWRVSDLEAKITAAEPTTASIGVALLTDPTLAPATFSEELLKTLTFNGKLAIDKDNQSAFLPIKFEVVPQNLQHAMEIAQMAPRIIVVAMGPNFPSSVIGLIESNWPSNKPRPHYVLTHISYEASPFEGKLPNTTEGNDLRLRISGTHPRLTETRRANMQSYEARYFTEFQSPADGNASGYEAAYAMAYAIVAASTVPGVTPVIDGPAISAGFAKLVSGPAIDVAPSTVNDAVTTLIAPGTIDLRGLSSELDWNLDTRDVTNDMTMYCFGRVVKDGGADSLVLKEAGDVVYSAKTGTVTGTYACD